MEETSRKQEFNEDVLLGKDKIFVKQRNQGGPSPRM